MDNTTFIDGDGHIVKTSPMKDEHQLIKITEKTPFVGNIKFIVKNELGTFTEDAVNLQYNAELIRFSWILSDSVTYKSGTVTAAIIFIGKESNQNYALKTIPFNIKIDNSLDFLDINPPYKDWFTDIETRLLDLENNGTGTNITNFETIPINFQTDW